MTAERELLRECREILDYYATSYRIGDEAGELGFWPDGDEVKRCAAAYHLLPRIEALLATPQPERDAVIEQCARVCEGVSLRYFGKHGQGAATNCAIAIRALKSAERKEG